MNSHYDEYKDSPKKSAPSKSSAVVVRKDPWAVLDFMNSWLEKDRRRDLGELSDHTATYSTGNWMTGHITNPIRWMDTMFENDNRWTRPGPKIDSWDLSKQRYEECELIVKKRKLADMLREYMLTEDQLAQLGYPVQLSTYPGYAVMVNHQQHPRSLRSHQRHSQHHLDVNARVFVPASCAGDSGTDSAGSSLESSDDEQESSSDSDKSSDIGYSQSSRSSSSISGTTAVQRRCARCDKNFYVSRYDGEYLQEEKCCYHWGKLRSTASSHHAGESWQCCQGRESSRGCTTARAHVWTGIVPGFNGPFKDYVCTKQIFKRNREYGIYALDCEMCFTKRGLELGKVTVVEVTGEIKYQQLVKTEAEVIDYNTRFSGLRAEDLDKATKSLKQVQEDLLTFLFHDTVLIGHGLENDLRALKIVHATVVDTCVAYPHFLGSPFKMSLKTLARTVLNKEIQVEEHDSTEDAMIAAELMLAKVEHDLL